MMPAAFSWATFTASVSAVPAATLVIWRSLPAEPTDTVFARSATEPAPKATALPAIARALPPIAIEFIPAATAAPPNAIDSRPIACASSSVEFAWKYLSPPPFTMVFIVFLMLVTLSLTSVTFADNFDTFWFVA